MTISPTDTPKRLSDDELAKIVARNSLEKNYHASLNQRLYGADADVEALLSHIAALTAPPSQGKVERVRHETRAGEILKEKAEAYLITGLFVSNPILSVAMNAAITQALTESPGQGTDGAEAMREVVVAALDPFYPNPEAQMALVVDAICAAVSNRNTVSDVDLREILAASTRKYWTEEEARNIIQENDTPSSLAALEAMRKIRALPLPVSADGSAVVVYLREIDAGTDNACWAICNKVDDGAVAFEGVRP